MYHITANPIPVSRPVSMHQASATDGRLSAAAVSRFFKTTSIQNRQHGFTLVELVIVILLIGILAVTFGSRFVAKSAYAERRAADELVEALRYAQQLAMSRGGNIRLVTTATTYTVEKTDGTPIRNPNGSGNYSVSLPDGVNIAVVTISFNSLGQPTPATDSSITVGSFNITIEGETGYAHY